MVLYLAGLKSVDPSLREAAAIDGAIGASDLLPGRPPGPASRSTSSILVITVIESLRAFDIVYVINKGHERPRTAVGPDHPEHRRRVVAGRVRVGARGRPAGHLGRPDHHLPDPDVRGAVMTAVAERDWRSPRAVASQEARRCSRGRVALHAFLIFVSLLWLFPLLWAVYTSLRPYGDTAKNGYVSIAAEPDPRQLLQRVGPGQHPARTSSTRSIILVPAVIVVLLLASAIAVRGVALQLQVQPAPADAVHGRQPAPGAGHHHAALPDVPGPAAAGAAEHERHLVRPVLRDHR